MKRKVPVFVIPALLAASVAFPAQDNGGLLGWVEDTRGVPVAGAVISLFGKGVGAAGLVTLSDSTGRFFLPSLPAGSYTVRALRAGHVAPARQVTVLPNRELRFTMSLTPEAEAAAAAAAAAADKAAEDARPRSGANDNQRELAWLLRHKRRSVLEEHDGAAASADGDTAPQSASLAPFLPALGATLEVMTHPESVGLGDQLLDGDGPTASLSALRLQGRLSELGTWSLGGLVSESGSTSWRMAAEFVLEAGEHQIRAGSGYGTRMLRPMVEGPAERDGGVGAIFVEDRWEACDELTATVGGRYSHVGFLEHANYLDPTVSVQLRPTGGSAVTASVGTQTLAPGGDLLTLSTLATAPSIAMAAMGDDLRAQRAMRMELAIEETRGPLRVRAHAFYQDAHNPLGNAFSADSSVRSLRIFNTGHLTARGMGLTISRQIGVVTGSMTYTYGHGWRSGVGQVPEDLLAERALTFTESDFHDLEARVETVIAGTDTRLLALYRLNSLTPQGDERAVNSTRFDVQLSQGLPFLGDLTHADWDLLVAVRNFYYETDESGAILDEVAVLNPPRRVLGGIAVRF